MAMTTTTTTTMRLLAFALPLLLLVAPLPCTALQSALNRRKVLGAAAASTIATLLPHQPVLAFEGGVGGLGKTKPDTGVILREGSAPIQNSKGIVTAEIVSERGNPILVEFQAPYPLLGSTSLQARDLQQPESAFVQVIGSNSNKKPATNKALNVLLTDSIFGSQGKFGAYGSPTDVKISPASNAEDNILYKASFTTYTPGMLESNRKILLNCQWCDADSTLVVLVVGTTAARFKSQEATLTKIATSLVAIDAPKTGLQKSAVPLDTSRKL
jgi:hypothetical protein